MDARAPALRDRSPSGCAPLLEESAGSASGGAGDGAAAQLHRAPGEALEIEVDGASVHDHAGEQGVAAQQVAERGDHLQRLQRDQRGAPRQRSAQADVADLHGDGGRREADAPVGEVEPRGGEYLVVYFLRDASGEAVAAHDEHRRDDRQERERREPAEPRAEPDLLRRWSIVRHRSRGGLSYPMSPAVASRVERSDLRRGARADTVQGFRHDTAR